MSGFNVKYDHRWPENRVGRGGAGREGALAAFKRWLGLAPPPPARKLDTRRPPGAASDPNGYQPRR